MELSGVYPLVGAYAFGAYDFRGGIFLYLLMGLE